jgi:hypothetical protein
MSPLNEGPCESGVYFFEEARIATNRGTNQQIVGTRTSAPGQCHGRDPRGLVSAGSASVRRCYDDRPGLAILSPENRERLSDVTTQRGGGLQTCGKIPVTERAALLNCV